MGYIDKDAYKEKYLCTGWFDEISEEEFDAFPEADVMPVVHGKWIPTTCIDLQSGEWEKYRCSLCGRIEIVREPYCNCGAKMDLEE